MKERLISAVQRIHNAIVEKAKRFQQVVKVGPTLVGCDVTHAGAGDRQWGQPA